MSLDEHELVYSTDSPKKSVKKHISKSKRKPEQKNCSVPNDGIVRVSRETKGRKGKGVTLITGISASDSDINDLAKKFKQKCGAGGTVKNGVIEIQGDVRDRIVKELESLDYRVKRSGG